MDGSSLIAGTGVVVGVVATFLVAVAGVTAGSNGL
jgi:hypothetical protein